MRFAVPAGCQSGQFNYQETVPFWPSFIRAAPLAKKTASLIKKETFGTRFGNRPLLGFAFRYNNGKM
jgi:hypothetical protein